ncbi:hypothetical protein KP509_27G058200 [Ceratopteris richardii]|uniref:U-box domain-containing protein n=1 Tax=Ceratopteris richardii TaxID=49495 RepID=A0A8T2RIT8_CERRI|nr:hypothetical protein KP509_27G058200 [Ceratopteris richardii]
MSCPDVDIFNRIANLDSPRSSSTSIKRRTCAYKKWKAVLAQFSPPRLALPLLSNLKPSVSSPNRASAISSPPFIPSSPNGASAISSPPFIPSNLLVDDGCKKDSTLNQSPLCISHPVANGNVQELLRTLALPRSHSHAQIQSSQRASALSSLYSMCISSPGIADLCSSEGAVEILLGLLNSRADSQSPSSVDMPAWVHETEKALLLLQLLISSSGGCPNVFNHSTLLISTLQKKLLRLSDTSTELVITILIKLCRHPSATAFNFCHAVSETAIPGKLVVVLQVACKQSIKQKAATLLRIVADKNEELDNPS